MDFLNNYLIYLIPVLGLVGIFVMLGQIGLGYQTGNRRCLHDRTFRIHCRWGYGLFKAPSGKY